MAEVVSNPAGWHAKRKAALHEAHRELLRLQEKAQRAATAAVASSTSAGAAETASETPPSPPADEEVTSP